MCYITLTKVFFWEGGEGGGQWHLTPKDPGRCKHCIQMFCWRNIGEKQGCQDVLWCDH